MIELVLSKIVIDANIIFSALIKDSTTRYLITYSDDIQLITPHFIIQEISTHLHEFSKRFNVEKYYLEKRTEEIFELGEIKTIKAEVFSDFMNEAMKLISDSKDTPYLALALKMNCPIWSNDKHFKKQSRVRVYSTQELLKELVE